MSALLVVGHGTKSPQGVADFAALVDRVRLAAGGHDVEGGFLELAPPPIQDGVAKLVAAGHRTVDVVPLVLVAAGHSKGDIPAALERERRRHPGLAFRYGRPLGPHPLLLSDLEERLAAVAPREQWEETAVVLVGRGATDPDANAEIAKTARLLFEGRGIGTVETSFISLAAPGVPAALDRARRLGFSRLVVLPYFLFAGVLPERIMAQAQEWARRHPDSEVRVAGLIGPSERLALLVRERWAEIGGGDLRMNCDTCAYRVALPGFGDKVGAPQTPHDHPDDPAHSHGHGHGHGEPHAQGHGEPHGHGHGDGEPHAQGHGEPHGHGDGDPDGHGQPHGHAATPDLPNGSDPGLSGGANPAPAPPGGANPAPAPPSGANSGLTGGRATGRGPVQP